MAVHGDVQGLLTLIENEHLNSFDENDTSPASGYKRAHLEENVYRYLCHVPQHQKFVCRETGEVLQKSVNSDKFDGRRAISAWNTIQRYAGNLLAQPWRKEFRNLKLYSGFYKHEVEERLEDAELMFEAMGYCMDRNSTMTIADVLDPDKILSVSRDAIFASVECRIMTEIWEKLYDVCNYTWSDIFQYRQQHVGTPERAVIHLTYMHQRSQVVQLAENHVRSDYAYDSSAGYFNHRGGHTYSYPMYGMSGPQMLHAPSSVYGAPIHLPGFAHAAIRPIDLYPHADGLAAYRHYPAPQMSSSRSMHEGYLEHHHHHHRGYPVPHNFPPPPQSVVPTAQLIELDAPPHNINAAGLRGRYSGEEDLPRRWQDLEKNGGGGGGYSSGKGKADGAGYDPESHYLLENSEDRGCRKSSSSSSSRRDMLGSKGSNYARSSSNSVSDVKLQGELVEKMKKMSAGGQSSSSKSEVNSRSEAEDPPRSKPGRTSSDAPKEHDKAIAADVRSGGAKGKRSLSNGRTSPGTASASKSSSSSSSSSSGGGRKKDVSVGNGSAPEKAKTTAKASFEAAAGGDDDDDPDEDGWMCKTCTFLNSKLMNICEMCAKSRDPGDESKPQTPGGQKCCNCTLINEPGQNYCAACNKSLKDCPTYI